MSGLNSNTKLLLHCDGTNGSTTFTDSKLTSPHTVTANGNAQISTTTPKFGTGCALFDGTGDYLSADDSADWDIVGSNSDNWTVDFQIKYTDAGGAPADGDRIISQWEDNNNYWSIYIWNAGMFLNCATGGGLIIATTSATTITDSNWHHFALVKKANEYGIYLDGTQVAYTQDNDTDTYAGSLLIGGRTDAEFLAGRLDEIRIQNSNYFNASPNVGKTDTITVPTVAYSEDKGGAFLFNFC